MGTRNKLPVGKVYAKSWGPIEQARGSMHGNEQPCQYSLARMLMPRRWNFITAKSYTWTLGA
jgi:hypothetical protein